MGPSDPPIQCTARGVPTGPIGLLLWRVLLRLFRLCMTDTKQPNCFTVISGSYVQLDWLLWLLSVATDFVTTRHDRPISRTVASSAQGRQKLASIYVAKSRQSHLEVGGALPKLRNQNLCLFRYYFFQIHELAEMTIAVQSSCLSLCLYQPISNKMMQFVCCFACMSQVISACKLAIVRTCT